MPLAFFMACSNSVSEMFTALSVRRDGLSVGWPAVSFDGPGELDELRCRTSFAGRPLPYDSNFAVLTLIRPVSVSAVPVDSTLRRQRGNFLFFQECHNVISRNICFVTVKNPCNCKKSGKKWTFSFGDSSQVTHGFSARIRKRVPLHFSHFLKTHVLWLKWRIHTTLQQICCSSKVPCLAS